MKKLSVLSANDLVLLSEISEAGSLAEAARRVGGTRAALSLRVKTMEKKCGVQLFRRNTHAIVPTEIGAVLCSRGTVIRELTQEAAEGIQQRTGVLSGNVHVCIPTGYGTEIVKVWIFEFAKIHPDVTVRLTIENAVDDLVARNIDVSVRVATKPEEGVIATKIRNIKYGLYGARIIADAGVPGDPSELEKLPMLVSDFVGRRGRILAEREGERRLVDINPRLITSNFLLIRDAIYAGIGWGFLPDYLEGASDSEEPLINALSTWKFEPYGMSIYVVRLSERHQSPVVKAMADYIMHRAGQVL